MESISALSVLCYLSLHVPGRIPHCVDLPLSLLSSVLPTGDLSGRCSHQKRGWKMRSEEKGLQKPLHQCLDTFLTGKSPKCVKTTHKLFFLYRLHHLVPRTPVQAPNPWLLRDERTNFRCKSDELILSLPGFPKSP